MNTTRDPSLTSGTVDGRGKDHRESGNDGMDGTHPSTLHGGAVETSKGRTSSRARNRLSAPEGSSLELPRITQGRDVSLTPSGSPRPTSGYGQGKRYRTRSPSPSPLYSFLLCHSIFCHSGFEGYRLVSSRMLTLLEVPAVYVR